MSTFIRIFPRPLRFPNFLKYPVHADEDQSISVGELSPEDAAALWDEWKPLWLEHVAKRAGSTVDAAQK